MKLLKSQSWKIFSLMTLIPILSIITSVLIEKQTGLDLKITAAFLAAFSMMFTYFGWIWSAGMTLNKLSDANSKISWTTFKYLIILTPIVSFILIPLIRNTIGGEYSSSILSIINLCSFSLFLLTIYFVTDKLYSIKTQREYSTNSKLMVFFCVWLLPIGIWFIRPKIKAILSENNLI